MGSSLLVLARLLQASFFFPNRQHQHLLLLCSWRLGSLVFVGALRGHPGVGGGVGPASDGVPVRLAAHHHHGRRDGVLVVLRAAALVPPLVSHRGHEWHVCQALHDRAARPAGRLLGCAFFPLLI